MMLATIIPEVAQFQCIDKHIRGDPIIEAFLRRLLAIRPMNENFPRRLTERSNGLHRWVVKKFQALADKEDSFTSEYRVLRPDGKTLWLRGHGRVVARSPDGKAHRLVSIVSDVTERKAAEDRSAFLMHELSHRSKNLLAVIQSIARRTARTAETMEEFENRFGQRLQGRRTALILFKIFNCQ